MLDHDLVLKSDELYLVGNISTDGSRERATGLFVRDTRHLSRFFVTLNGTRPERLQVRLDDATRATVISANPLMRLESGVILPPQKVLIEQRVSLSDVFSVQFTLRNFGCETIELALGMAIAADFRDLFDIRGYPRVQRGSWNPPELGSEHVTLSYQGLDGLRAETMVGFGRPGIFRTTHVDLPHGDNSVFRLPGIHAEAMVTGLTDPPEVHAAFPLRLEPGESWELTATVRPRPADGIAVVETPRASSAGTIRTGDALVDRVLDRCLRDLDALQTSFPHGRVPAAGIPWFVAPFGRDSVISGLQTLHLAPERAMATLRVLAALQGVSLDPAREEEPGKILHEMRYGEMARTGEIPHTPYYGSVDATPLFVWLCAETVIWTADRGLYAELLPHIERALDWVEQYGDLDGDGLIEYRSDHYGTGRITNQVWKDSHDSLNHADGSPVIGPIAAVEVQGYLYAALDRMAAVFAMFGDPERASAMGARASALREQIERQFWLPEVRFYAQALDGTKRPVRALTSNPGHLLLAGVPSGERAGAIASRFAEPRFDSGWGIRTLASDAVTYNPMSYHNGSVWPHDNSLIAAGLYKYGQIELGGRVARALLEAAAVDPIKRLPELFCGFQRGVADDEGPVPYPVSCSPQAWAAGALPFLVRAMLGLDVEPRSGELIVRPRLPDWLSRVTIDPLTVRGVSGRLTVERDGGGYRIDAEGIPLAAAAAVR